MLVKRTLAALAIVMLLSVDTWAHSVIITCEETAQ